MLMIIPNKEKARPKDYAFMEQSEKVLSNIPDTWKQYPDNIEGMCKIIDMEYNELKMAKTTDTKSHELVHLASACLHLWRKLNNVE